MSGPGALHWTGIAIATGITIAAAQTAAEPRPLRHNPFDRPLSIVPVRATPAEFADNLADRPLELRATMVGPGTRLADVGGRILEPGDSIGDYELVRVDEDRAVFVRHGKTVTLLVKSRPEDQDE